ncbi:chorismate mutase [Paenibacillus aestuarii]|uniref:Chorismate mutase n=1 Tax=Paenibacillus aestuarii TaxID=516965 RepID=A0ABW0KE35_9BACL|nr:chorismate mutase [Paenibacillus aestuarii]
MSHRELNELRAQVDEINVKLLELLNERARIVEKIGEYKRSAGMLDVYDPKRERESFEYLTRRNQGPFDDEMIKNIFKQIFDESSELQKRQRI